MFIVCFNCSGSWKVASGVSVYQELLLSRQPCPACEAYTLAYQQKLPQPQRRLSRFWLRQASAGRRVARERS